MTATLDNEVAELRRANAELQRRLDEALTREVATAEVMAVINSSPGDLTPVFEALLETGARLCRAEQAVITLRNSQDGLYHYGTSFGYSAEFKELLVGNPVAPGRTSLLGRTALEGQVVHIEDAAVDPEYKWAEALRLGRWHTGLGVPLLRNGTVVGVVALTRKRVERFTDKQIELIKTLPTKRSSPSRTHGYWSTCTRAMNAMAWSAKRLPRVSTNGISSAIRCGYRRV
jgi:GAF domain-containing protein